MSTCIVRLHRKHAPGEVVQLCSFVQLGDRGYQWLRLRAFSFTLLPHSPPFLLSVWRCLNRYAPPDPTGAPQVPLLPTGHSC